MDIEWKNVSVQVRKKKCDCRRFKKGGNIILNDVSGSVNPGQFLAILGASGAGKTTLLNFIAGKLSHNLKIKGQGIFINGIPKEKLKTKGIYGFVQQKDELLDLFTVRGIYIYIYIYVYIETIMFAAEMRLRVGKEEKRERVEEILEELELQHIGNSKVGNILNRGISGGERKRTSIGIELISNLPILLLDEPTTGLDSYMATTVIEIIRKLTLKGRTIISTIHQPNSQIFDLFDKLMLLSQGSVIYADSALLAVDYFAQQGYICPMHKNPSEYFLEIMTNDKYEAGISEGVGEGVQDPGILAYNQRIQEMVIYYENHGNKIRESISYNIIIVTKD